MISDSNLSSTLKSTVHCDDYQCEENDGDGKVEQRCHSKLLLTAG